MILILLTSLALADTTEINRIDITKDRITSLQEISDSIRDTLEYKILLEKLNELDQRVESLENPDNTKRNVMKTIGYTSSTLGFVTSIWGIYEKVLSINNNKIDLDIRLKTRENITREIEYIKSINHDEMFLAKKMENLGEINEKITNINTRLKINRIALNRGIFKGVTSIGLFALTFFIDDISLWLEKKFYNEKNIALHFLYTWNINVVEMGIFPSQLKHYTIEEKSLFYFADSKTLGIKEEAFLDALHEFKVNNPERYEELQLTAKNTLTKILMDNIKGEINYLDIRLTNGIMKLKLFVCEPDATYVKPCMKEYFIK